MAVFWISMVTVYMGEQIPQVAFLLIGWSQSVMAGSTQMAGSTKVESTAKFRFARVFE
jgi:hypothetical protein